LSYVIVKMLEALNFARCLNEKCRSSLTALTLACVCLLVSLSASPALALQAHSYLTPARNALPPFGARELCKDYAWACSVSASRKNISNSDFSVINEVNRSVNRSVREVTDLSQFRVTERWNLPTSRGGDCEDFALLKKHELIRRGFPAQLLLIATALDKNRRGHAVLIVRTSDGDVVLDNLTTRVKNWSETGYIFLRMQNPKAPASWVSLTMLK
jgi:predicted transglutaminase-like cysteine proteinase